MVLYITQGMEGIQMIIETLLILVSLGILYIVWHSLYTHYKEKEWRRNNPEEHDIMDRPVKKDPGLE